MSSLCGENRSGCWGAQVLMLPQPSSSVPLSSVHACALPSRAISSQGPDYLCASLLGLRLLQRDPRLVGASTSLSARVHTAILASAVTSVLAPRERRREPKLGEGETEWEEREDATCSRKKLLRFPPHSPSYNGGGADLSSGLAFPLASPTAADTRRKRKWKSKRNRLLQQDTIDFPFSSTCPSLPLAVRQKYVQEHANILPGVVQTWGRERGTPHIFTLKLNLLSCALVRQTPISCANFLYFQCREAKQKPVFPKTHLSSRQGPALSICPSALAYGGIEDLQLMSVPPQVTASSVIMSFLWEEGSKGLSLKISSLSL